MLKIDFDVISTTNRFNLRQRVLHLFLLLLCQGLELDQIP